MTITLKRTRSRPRRRTRRAGVMVGLALLSAVSVVVVRTNNLRIPGLVWSDEFDGPQFAAPSASTWHYAAGAWGWGNNELECYTDSRDNSALDGNGHLVITARQDPGHVCSDGAISDYTSARLLTSGLRTTEYGHIEVRAKLPSAPGIWPAAWALGFDHDTIGWPASGEIDIVEKIGSEPRVAHGTVHGPKADGSPYYVTGSTVESGDPGGTYHVYGVDWTPTSIAFEVDGKVYNTVTKAEVERQGSWVFDKPFYLLLNLAVGGDWPGYPTDATQWPQRMVVDYVRVYRDAG